MPAPIKPVRLSLDQAAGELDIDVGTLRKRLRTAGIGKGKDGKLGILDAAKAIFSDLRGEQTRLPKENADKVAWQNAISRNEYIHRQRVLDFLENIFLAVKSKIYGSHLSDDEKEKILWDLVSLQDSDHLWDLPVRRPHETRPATGPEKKARPPVQSRVAAVVFLSQRLQKIGGRS